MSQTVVVVGPVNQSWAIALRLTMPPDLCVVYSTTRAKCMRALAETDQSILVVGPEDERRIPTTPLFMSNEDHAVSGAVCVHDEAIALVAPSWSTEDTPLINIAKGIRSHVDASAEVWTSVQKLVETGSKWSVTASRRRRRAPRAVRQ